MSDLISRQAALDALTEYWKGISDRHPTLDGEMAVYADCKVIIKRLPSAKPDLSEYSDKLWRNAYERGKRDVLAEPQWIPCSERLPEEDVKVLISYQYKEGEGDTSHTNIDITTYGQMYFGGNKVGNYKHWRSPFEYFESNYEVVAWMPLPEPYQGNRKGEHHEID